MGILFRFSDSSQNVMIAVSESLEKVAAQRFPKKHFCHIEPKRRYTNTKASLAVYGTWFALIVNVDDYEGEFYPETKQPTYKEIQAWIKEKYGFNVNSASISQTKRKYGLIAASGDIKRRYTQRVHPEKEAAIREALIWFGLLVRE